MAPRPLLLLVLIAACGPAAPASPPAVPAPVAAATTASDVCAGSPPVPRSFTGLLRGARCDQEMYWSMSRVADQLGVNCTHCHAHETEDVKSCVFPPKTPQKDVANWMSAHLMQAVKPADGSPLTCASCHTDAEGRPVAKILGAPRDPVKANEWMSLVMVRKFVAADGSKLRCSSCHAGTPGTAEFVRKVILQNELLPKHEEGGKGTPAF
jgi:hypothetical protein